MDKKEIMDKELLNEEEIELTDEEAAAILEKELGDAADSFKMLGKVVDALK